jgi:hypothetical protein
MPFDVFEKQKIVELPKGIDILPGTPTPASSFLKTTGPFGVDRLDPGLTINGTTVYPMVRYNGKDASALGWPQWNFGEALDYVAVATAPDFNDGSPYLGDNDDAVKFNSSDYYSADNNDLGDITTEDIVLEFVAQFTGDASNDGLINKFSATGWLLQYSTVANTLTFVINDGSQVNITSAALTPKAWYHGMLFINRNEASANGSQWYLTGAASGAGVNASGASGSLTVADKMEIGRAFAANYMDGGVAYLAVWKQSDWHQAGAAGPTEWAAIVKERFYKLSGIWPMSAKGTEAPNFFTRATAAYLDKYESDGSRKLYYMPSGAPIVLHRKDSAGDSIKGYLPEQADTNCMLHSEDLTNAAWTKTRCTISANGVVAPNGETTADGIISTAVANTHFVAQSVAGNTEDVASAWFKAGDKEWAFISTDSNPNQTTYFHLSGNGTVGTVEAGVTSAHIEAWGNGWYRCIIVYPGAALHVHQFGPAEADNDSLFTGDGVTVDVWMWGANHSCIGHSYALSYIPTVGASVTRNKNQLQYVGLANLGGVGSNLRGAAYFRLLNFEITIPASTYYGEISDGGATSNTIRLINTITSGVPNLTVVTGGAVQVTIQGPGGSETNDGAIHNYGALWATDDFELWSDGTLRATDTSGTPPDDLDQIDIGQRVNDTLQPNCVISDLYFYPYPAPTKKDQ